MEDDEGDTTVAGEEPVVGKKVTGKQDGVTVLHSDRGPSDSNADKSNSPASLVEEKSKGKLECEDNRKSCCKIETSCTHNDSQNSGTFESDVPKSPKKVNGEVELSKCECAGQKTDAEETGGKVVKNAEQKTDIEENSGEVMKNAGQKTDKEENSGEVMKNAGQKTDKEENGDKVVKNAGQKTDKEENGDKVIKNAGQKTDNEENSGKVVKNSRLADDETPNPETENTRTLRKRKRPTSPIQETDKGKNSESNVEFKGFKKRYIAQSTVATNNKSSGDPSVGTPKSGSKFKKSSKKTSTETQHLLISHKTTPAETQHLLVSHQTLPDGTQSSAQLTEYTQYLGLQPTVKFKCYICGESGFPSMLTLQKHQNTCLRTSNKIRTPVKPTPPPPTTDPSPSTNFRITRKVYLCSACGTYYENWNLFLHMREVHKRHICLFCLGMFSQADKLATHLSGKHAVVEGVYASADNFLSEFKGSYFLMCCTCERIFTERENFFDHSCSEGLVINADKACSLCGLRGAHFPTCRRAFTDSSSSAPPLTSSVPATVENPPEPTQDSQVRIQESPQISLSVTKYLIPVEKVTDKKTNQKSNDVLDNVEEAQEKSRDLSDNDDDYDISNAASFCHVNIHESQEKQKQAVTSKLRVYKGKRQTMVAEKSVCELEPADTTPPSTNTNQNNEDSAKTVDDAQDDESVQDKIADLDDKITDEKEPDECEDKTEKEVGDIAPEPAIVVEENKEEQKVEEKEEDEKMEVEEEKSEDAEKTELQNDEKPESPAIEETESNVENDTQLVPEEQKDTEPSLQKESDTKLSSPKPEDSPKVSQQPEAKVSSKAPSATEADSESESSDSGEDTDETSSSSDASSEESDHHEEAEEKDEKIDGSDIDNADSDKMSLVVDENRSEEEEEEEEETELQKENTDDVEKQISDEKVSDTEEIKEDEPKSDSELAPNITEETEESKVIEDEKVEEQTESVQLAGDDVPLLELTLEENLDIMSIQLLLKESVKVSCLNCVYCNHAKKIAVNGKQLALHLLAEHRFAPVVCSDSGELTEADGFVDRLKALLPELQHMFFNTDSYDNMDQTCVHPYDRTYECFHCHFVTTLHKELYVHNRKMHQKTILLCIMCKSNFYSYSELLCHLCPGIYVPESNICFRCCLCAVDGLPSAFRLMVHLRKRHHACDVCLETTGDQQKLSNHVWKHKLHHLCYRCGIAYRNKPDITKHLFWKHGTESVLCKKCLQKKWPHVYHFCIPPNAFVCEECNSSFSRAVALKVHKRLHAGDLPYSCSECEERFISRKLLTKHEDKHREPPAEPMETKLQENGPIDEIESQEKIKEGNIRTETEPHEKTDVVGHDDAANNGNSTKEEEELETKRKDSLSEADVADAPVEPSVAESADELGKQDDKDTCEKKSKVVDVYDLPPLNLSSESDDSDVDEVERKTQVDIKGDKSPAVESPVTNEGTETCDKEKLPEPMQVDDDVQQPIEVVDGIWDNFNTYKANLERRESQHLEIGESSTQKSESSDKHFVAVLSVINMDHDYCGPPAGTSQTDSTLEQPEDTLAVEAESTQEPVPPMQDKEKTEEPKENTEEEKKACDADHNYCYTNTTSLNVEDEKEKDMSAEPTVEAASPTKKKQKSPKKKQKRSASSSSSDSSSSDSSTCSCGTNCSCSSSSSSSSGSSSSQSSDSDSSSSEGRRRQAARRERRRERAKKKKIEETEESPPVKPEATEVAANGSPGQEETPLPLPSVVEPEEVDVPIRESDLDTDETDTDEDFYDKYPQKQANKLLAEKRNQLLMLAAVAPVNNGTMSQSGQSPPSSAIEEPIPKKKVKTKKHKKSQHQHSSSESKAENKLKLNIPSDYYGNQAPVFSKSTMPTTSSSNSMNTAALTPTSQSVPSPFLASHPDPATPSAAYHSTGSGSETDSKRLSKRKRVPKRFYGDSSDEESEQQPPVKWRKVLPAASNSPVTTPQQTSGYTYKSSTVSAPEPVHVPSVPTPIAEEKSEEEAVDDSDSDRDDVKKSSTESSNSESEADKEQDDDDDDDLSDADSEVETPPTLQTSTVSSAREGEGVQQRNENLYCYCQCPYDEVSEMIACDGKDCTIEWFHFECVGIMVPPKGKWFCPDCRKRAAARSEYLVHVG